MKRQPYWYLLVCCLHMILLSILVPIKGCAYLQTTVEMVLLSNRFLEWAFQMIEFLSWNHLGIKGNLTLFLYILKQKEVNLFIFIIEVLAGVGTVITVTLGSIINRQAWDSTSTLEDKNKNSKTLHGRCMAIDCVAVLWSCRASVPLRENWGRQSAFWSEQHVFW